MSGEYNPLYRVLGEAEAAFDWLKYRLRKRREPGRYHLQPYRGHGTLEALHISGRVFEGLPVPAARSDDAYLRNFWHTMQRLGRDDVPAARLTVTAGGVTRRMLANEEGYFEADLDVPTVEDGAVGEVWREVEIALVDPPSAFGEVRAKGYCIVPPAEATFGIISDIDDTIVETDVANLMRMMRLVLLTNAHTRLSFPGVAAFYRALHRGPAGPFTNPLFYVSSSPWNFYDLLTEVFDVHGIPQGPLFLKDYGLARDLLLSRGHFEHKVSSIDRILATHAQLDFVLVGDSGQKDPEVYCEIVRRNPGRIRAIYIRDVSEDIRDQEIVAIAEEVGARGVEMVFVENTLAAAEHALGMGLIDEQGLADVRGERSDEKREPGPFEAVLRP